MEDAEIISLLNIIRFVTVSFLLACCVFKEVIPAATASASMVRFCHCKNTSNLLIFATVAAFTMFVWDYILTFRMEVDLVWKSKWTFMKGLFLFQRYLPFIDTVWLILYRQPNTFSIFFP